MITQHFNIKPQFAKRERIPTSFVATVLAETQRALYVYGHGATDPQGTCCKCGRTLTHPGSILLGIGPVCIGDWGARDVVMENITEADKARLQALIREQRVDGWIPRGVVKETLHTEERIDIPKDHKMLITKKNQAPQQRVARVEGNEFIITFPYDAETVAQVKTKLPGRKWNPTKKHWICPISTDAALALRSWGFEITGLDQSALERLLDPFTHVDEVPAIDPPNLRKELYPFQKQGVGFIEARGGRALVADEMGLGKTVQALGWLQLHQEKRPVIIVTPASLKLNWLHEINQWMYTDDRAVVVNGKKPYSLRGADIVIINYDILADWLKAIQAIRPQVVITDECHYYKSNKTKRTRAVKQLARMVKHFIALSGTPIVNRPIEGYNAIRIIEPTLFPSSWDFARRYCNARHNGYGWDFTGASHTEELHEKLTNTLMIRRKKADVLKELPDKTRAFVPVELDNQDEYFKAENDFENFVRDNVESKLKDQLQAFMKKYDLDAIDFGEHVLERAKEAKVSKINILTQIEALKQVAVRGKMAAVTEWVADFLETGEKLVLFATHRAVIDQLMERFGSVAVKIDGGVSQTARDTAVRRFQEDDGVRLFVGNIKAAGVGLTLTASSNVAFVELPWTPGELTQAEDRCHRIGQRDAVNVYYLLAANTIENDIAELLDKKRQVLDAVLDGVVTDDESLLTELIRKYTDQ